MNKFYRIAMKFFFMLLMTVVIFFSGGCKDSSKKLIMVTSASFPMYEYISGGEIDGIDPAIIRTIAERLGYELEIHDMNFDSVLAAVQSGKAHIAASGLTVTEERKQKVLFTIPYVTTDQLIVVPANSTLTTSAQLKGKRIGVQHGTTGDAYVTTNIGNPERFKDAPTAIAALAIGKLDAVVIDGEPAQIFVSRNPKLRLIKEPLTKEEYAFAISQKNPELLEKVNAELLKMKREGEIERILRHYDEEKEKLAFNAAHPEAQGFWGRLKNSFELNFIKDNRYMYLVDGLWVSLTVTFCSVIIGIIIGFIVAVIRSCHDQTGKLKVADFFCRIYLTLIRGIPAVVQLMIIYFVIFKSVNVDKVVVAIIAFGINSGAYTAEIIRGGIMAIDKGQMEGGRSLGLSYLQCMRFIILPQSFKNVLPALGNECIVLLKETSVAGFIALQDLTKGGDIIRSLTYDAFLPLIAVALIYLVLVMVMSYLLGIFERRLKKNE